MPFLVNRINSKFILFSCILLACVLGSTGCGKGVVEDQDTLVGKVAPQLTDLQADEQYADAVIGAALDMAQSSMAHTQAVRELEITDPGTYAELIHHIRARAGRVTEILGVLGMLSPNNGRPQCIGGQGAGQCGVYEPLDDVLMDVRNGITCADRPAEEQAGCAFKNHWTLGRLRCFDVQSEVNGQPQYGYTKGKLSEALRSRMEVLRNFANQYMGVEAPEGTPLWEASAKYCQAGRPMNPTAVLLQRADPQVWPYAVRKHRQSEGRAFDDKLNSIKRTLDEAITIAQAERLGLELALHQEFSGDYEGGQSLGRVLLTNASMDNCPASWDDMMRQLRLSLPWVFREEPDTLLYEALAGTTDPSQAQALIAQGFERLYKAAECTKRHLSDNTVASLSSTGWLVDRRSTLTEDLSRLPGVVQYAMTRQTHLTEDEQRQIFGHVLGEEPTDQNAENPTSAYGRALKRLRAREVYRAVVSAVATASTVVTGIYGFGALAVRPLTIILGEASGTALARGLAQGALIVGAVALGVDLYNVLMTGEARAAAVVAWTVQPDLGEWIHVIKTQESFQSAVQTAAIAATLDGAGVSLSAYFALRSRLRVILNNYFLDEAIADFSDVALHPDAEKAEEIFSDWFAKMYPNLGQGGLARARAVTTIEGKTLSANDIIRKVMSTPSGLRWANALQPRYELYKRLYGSRGPRIIIRFMSLEDISARPAFKEHTISGFRSLEQGNPIILIADNAAGGAQIPSAYDRALSTGAHELGHVMNVQLIPSMAIKYFRPWLERLAQLDSETAEMIKQKGLDKLVGDVALYVNEGKAIQFQRKVVMQAGLPDPVPAAELDRTGWYTYEYIRDFYTHYSFNAPWQFWRSRLTRITRRWMLDPDGEDFYRVGPAAAARLNKPAGTTTLPAVTAMSMGLEPHFTKSGNESTDVCQERAKAFGKTYEETRCLPGGSKPNGDGDGPWELFEDSGCGGARNVTGLHWACWGLKEIELPECNLPDAPGSNPPIQSQNHVFIPFAANDAEAGSELMKTFCRDCRTMVYKGADGRELTETCDVCYIDNTGGAAEPTCFNRAQL